MLPSSPCRMLSKMAFSWSRRALALTPYLLSQSESSKSCRFNKQLGTTRDGGSRRLESAARESARFSCPGQFFAVERGLRNRARGVPNIANSFGNSRCVHTVRCSVPRRQ